MADKRNELQRDFDWSLHGISFAHKEAQIRMFERAEIAFSKLDQNKETERKERLEFWRSRLEQ